MTDPVCRCFRVREETIREAIRKHDLQHVDEITASTRAGGGCGSCIDDLQAILDAIHGTALRRDIPDASGLTNAQRRDLVRRLLEEEILPLYDLNGLQMQMTDVAGDRILARFSGDAVGGTSASYLVLKRQLVRRASEVCGRKMRLIELNVLEAP